MGSLQDNRLTPDATHHSNIDRGAKAVVTNHELVACGMFSPTHDICLRQPGKDLAPGRKEHRPLRTGLHDGRGTRGPLTRSAITAGWPASGN